MAFADPQSVTIDAVAQSLPRTSSGVNTGQFTKADGNVRLTLTHVYGRRNRRTVRLDHTKIAADPLISAQSIIYSMSVYAVIDTPKTGYTVEEAKDVCEAMFLYLTASSSANTNKILGGES